MLVLLAAVKNVDQNFSKMITQIFLNIAYEFFKVKIEKKLFAVWVTECLATVLHTTVKIKPFYFFR
jgi:hypothetical protein